MSIASAAIGEHFEGVVKKYGDDMGVICKQEGNLRWTWRQFDVQVDALARGLHDLGLRKVGFRCSIVSSKIWSRFLTWLSLIWLGL